MRTTKPSGRLLALALGAGLLAGCAGADVQHPDWSPYDPKDQARRQRYGTITGTDGITLFGMGRRGTEPAAGSAAGAGGAAGIGVNAYLWRASLETLDFIPLVSADPFGGLIITDWYQPAEAPDERFKLQVLIRDVVLRADAVRVSVLRQRRDARGTWVDVPSDPRTATELEDKILTRARQIRIAAAGG
ncbi:MAG: DUF3576 domain-containing protein [Geminicoccaceae bacterium]|nr:DUF3576 domain-containing protein [Geminicoccaceae bacterium]